MLSREIVVGIFNGSITSWDDPRITALNPTLASFLRFKAVRPYHRTSLSGTTYLFTQSLCSFSSEWNNTYSSGMNIAWGFQQAEAIPSNADMVTAVSFKPFSIGYVGLGDLDLEDINGGRGNIRVAVILVCRKSDPIFMDGPKRTFFIFAESSRKRNSPFGARHRRRRF